MDSFHQRLPYYLKVPLYVLKQANTKEMKKLNALSKKWIENDNRFRMIEEKYGKIVRKNPQDIKLRMIADKGFETLAKGEKITNDIRKWISSMKQKYK